jgi:hypothetical protein
VDLGEEIVLVSRRRRFDWTVLSLRDPLDLAAFRLLDQPHTAPNLLRKLDGLATLADVEALLGRWLTLGIVFTDDLHYVHLAPAANNEELLRFDRHFDGSRPDDGPSPDPALPAPTAAGGAR